MANNKEIVYLTTTDNPWNPFTNWDEWYTYDMMMGYDTCGKLDRISTFLPTMPDPVNTEELHSAMDRLIEIGAIGYNGRVSEYVKVTKKA